MSDVSPDQSQSPLFVTTHWSVVLAAGQTDGDRARSALEELCRTYWFPLYAYIRRHGHQPEEAQDLTQEFFLRLIEKKSVRLADSERGKFRSFLLTSLKHFLINEWAKARAVKRGGGRQFLSLDAEEIETRFLSDPAADSTPDKAFERRWAIVTLDRVLDQLQAELAAAGRGQLFEELKSCLTGEDNESSYGEIGRRLGRTEGNLRVTVHRLRRRYRELLREEISRTVASPELIEEEIRELFAALAR